MPVKQYEDLDTTAAYILRKSQHNTYDMSTIGIHRPLSKLKRHKRLGAVANGFVLSENEFVNEVVSYKLQFPRGLELRSPAKGVGLLLLSPGDPFGVFEGKFLPRHIVRTNVVRGVPDCRLEGFGGDETELESVGVGDD